MKRRRQDAATDTPSNVALSGDGGKIPCKLPIVVCMDQGVLCQWFVLGGKSNPVPLLPGEMFMLSEWEEKGMVTLPTGEILRGEQVCVSSTQFQCVFFRVEIENQNVGVMLRIRKGWHHLYNYLMRNTNNFDVILAHRSDRPEVFWIKLQSILDPKSSVFGDRKPRRLGHGQEYYSLSPDVFAVDKDALIIDTSVSWGQDLELLLLVEDCSVITPRDPSVLSIIDALHSIHQRYMVAISYASACAQHESGVHEKMQARVPLSLPKSGSSLSLRVITSQYKHEQMKKYLGTVARAAHPPPQKDTTVPVKTDSVDCSIDSLVRKIHLVIDTNILIQEAGRKFTFFAHLEEHFDSKIVIVIPFAVYLELDHMKKGNREGALKGGDIARMAINFINVQVASGKHFFVIQTNEEDSTYIKQRKEGTKIGTQNDLRVVHACKVRLELGMHVQLLSNDTNLLNLGWSLGRVGQMECFSFAHLESLLSKPRFARLDPGFWGKVLQRHAGLHVRAQALHKQVHGQL